MSKTITELLGQVSPSASGTKRAVDIVAALAPPAAGNTELVKTEDKPSAAKLAMAWLPGLGGAAVGAYMWKSHRVLGAVAGHAVASTALPIMRGGPDRKRALCQLGVEGAAVAGSLYFNKGNSPIVGFLGGLAAGAVATAFVPGSATNDIYHYLRGKIGK